ncbi:MAG: hypothetical protein KDK74_03380 [Cephaloticoccus sp.]|nr:hypothetical protein [Cephaloticoccus sp.]
MRFIITSLSLHFRSRLVVPLLLAGAVLFTALPRVQGQTSTAEARMPLLMPDDFESLQLVAWRVEQGVPDSHNPLLEPAMPWDSGGVMAHGTVIHDPIDGLWKAWQVSTPVETELDGLKSQHEHRRRLTYLESDDGVHWVRPELSFVSWPGHDKTNIIFDFDSGGTSVYASVLVDPANREWPYEMFVMRSPKLAGVPNKVGDLPGPETKLGSYRYRSKDGKDWKQVEGPIHPSTGGGDVCYVYRNPDGSYVSYFKSYPPLEAGARIIVYDVNARQLQRAVSRRISPDGTHWEKDDVVLKRDWRDPDYAQFLELCPVQVKGGHVALINCYDSVTQTMSLEMAASRDGIHWWRPDRRRALPNAPLGDFGGGMIWQMHQPIVDQGKMYVYYAGSEGIHSAIVDTRFQPQTEVGNESVLGFRKGTLPFYTALCRASWDFDRLYALASAVGGPMPAVAVTHPLDLAGKRLAVNVRVKHGGALVAELLDTAGQPVPGFTAGDCQPVTGDHRRTVFTWEGGERAPASAAKIRFVIRRAFLYGYELF